MKHSNSEVEKKNKKKRATDFRHSIIFIFNFNDHPKALHGEKIGLGRALVVLFSLADKLLSNIHS